MSKSFKALINARDKALKRGAEYTARLSEGGIEMMVEDYGYKKTLEYIRSL